LVVQHVKTRSRWIELPGLTRATFRYSINDIQLVCNVLAAPACDFDLVYHVNPLI